MQRTIPDHRPVRADDAGATCDLSPTRPVERAPTAGHVSLPSDGARAICCLAGMLPHRRLRHRTPLRFKQTAPHAGAGRRLEQPSAANPCYAGSNFGSVISSVAFSKWTLSGMPISQSSGPMPSRSESISGPSSSSATISMYGTSSENSGVCGR